MSDKNPEVLLKELMASIDACALVCRERALLITKLQEAGFWLAAIPAEAWTSPGKTIGRPWKKP